MKALTQQDIIDHLSSTVDDSVVRWDQVPGTSEMLNLDLAVARFMKAVNNNERIVFVHDSDADGLGTYMLSMIFFKAFGYANIDIMITDRKNGYGFVPKYVDDRINDNVGLYITADNGITSLEACARAKELGIDTIITDHHQVDSYRGLPDAIVVDPHQEADTFPYPDINGSFVYWYFLRAIQEVSGTPIDMYTEFLPELALTTISDVMPLTGINRFIVRNGLHVFPTHHRQWVKTFFEMHDRPNVTAEDLSFGLIPSINVTSRLTNAEESAMFLTRENHWESKEWLTYIKTLNDVRKKRQEALMKDINTLYSSWIDAPFILVPGKNFEKGILGPTAGRIAQHHRKPTIIMSLNKAGDTYSGSGRSTGSINLLGLVKDNPYVIKNRTGGHKAACGVSVPAKDLVPFWQQLQKDTATLHPDLYIDKQVEPLGKIELRDIDYELFKSIDAFQPFGEKFKKPLFYGRAIFKKVAKMGKDRNHYQMIISDGLGTEIRAVWFFFTGELKSNKKYGFAFTINKETFKPKSDEDLSLMIEKIYTEVEWSDIEDKG